MAKRRIERLNSLLKEVIDEVVRREVRNPEVGELFTITRVSISRDLGHAKVWVSVIGEAVQQQRTLHALQTAAGFIATRASKKITIRYFPVLHFFLDDSAEKLMKIDQLLHELTVERKRRLGESLPEEDASHRSP